MKANTYLAKSLRAVVRDWVEFRDSALRSGNSENARIAQKNIERLELWIAELEGT